MLVIILHQFTVRFQDTTPSSWLDFITGGSTEHLTLSATSTACQRVQLSFIAICHHERELTRGEISISSVTSPARCRSLPSPLTPLPRHQRPPQQNHLTAITIQCYRPHWTLPSPVDLFFTREVAPSPLNHWSKAAVPLSDLLASRRCRLTSSEKTR